MIHYIHDSSSRVSLWLIIWWKGKKMKWTNSAISRIGGCHTVRDLSSRALLHWLCTASWDRTDHVDRSSGRVTGFNSNIWIGQGEGWEKRRKNFTSVIQWASAIILYLTAWCLYIYWQHSFAHHKNFLWFSLLSYVRNIPFSLLLYLDNEFWLNIFWPWKKNEVKDKCWCRKSDRHLIFWGALHFKSGGSFVCRKEQDRYISILQQWHSHNILQIIDIIKSLVYKAQESNLMLGSQG